MGRSVIEAIASYAGKPVRTLVDGQIVYRSTFISKRRFTIAPPGVEPLGRLTFSLVDVPDLQLLDIPGSAVGEVWFGVATRPSIYHLMLRVLARLVKWRLLPSVSPLAGLMHFVTTRMTWGSHRGGMFIELEGTDTSGSAVRRSWHLLAEGDVGPMIPTLAATAITEAWLAGELPGVGARAAVNEVPLASFASALKALAIRFGERVEPPPADQPLFRRYLGAAWDQLPESIRRLHSGTTFTGKASVARGSSWLARFIGKIVGFPGAVENVPLTVNMTAHGGRERWRRDFDGQSFSSTYSLGKGRHEHLMCERFGPASFAMALTPSGNELRYRPVAWTKFGIPMPKFLLPTGEMYERDVDGRFQFHVEINLPLVGHLVTYTGWLEPDPG